MLKYRREGETIGHRCSIRAGLVFTQVGNLTGHGETKQEKTDVTKPKEETY